MPKKLPAKRNHKATKMESLRRTRIVAELLLQGYTQREIAHYAAENWGIKRRQTCSYIEKAHKEFAHKVGKRIENRINYHIEMRHRLLRQSLERKEHSQIALSILSDLAKVEGIYDAVGSKYQRDVNINLNEGQKLESILQPFLQKIAEGLSPEAAQEFMVQLNKVLIEEKQKNGNGNHQQENIDA